MTNALIYKDKNNCNILLIDFFYMTKYDNGNYTLLHSEIFILMHNKYSPMSGCSTSGGSGGGGGIGGGGGGGMDTASSITNENSHKMAM